MLDLSSISDEKLLVFSQVISVYTIERARSTGRDPWVVVPSAFYNVP